MGLYVFMSCVNGVCLNNKQERGEKMQRRSKYTCGCLHERVCVCVSEMKSEREKKKKGD